jgi:hypothetical protein
MNGLQGFEAFELPAWLVDGLMTQHVKRRAGRQNVVRSRAVRWKASIAIAAAASVAIGLSASLPVPANATAQTVLAWPQYKSGASNETGPNIIPIDPAVYWSRMINTVRSWKQLPPAPDTEDPPSIF